MRIITIQTPLVTSAHHVIHGGRLEGREGVVVAGGEALAEGHRHRHLRPVAADPGRGAAHVLHLGFHDKR